MIQYTKITFESQDGIVSISIPKSDLTIWEVISELVQPMLLAARYSPDLVKDLFTENN